MRQTVRKEPAVFLMDMAGLTVLQCKQMYYLKYSKMFNK